MASVHTLANQNMAPHMNIQGHMGIPFNPMFQHNSFPKILQPTPVGNPFDHILSILNNLCSKFENLAFKSDMQSAEISKLHGIQESNHNHLDKNLREQSELLETLQQQTAELKQLLNLSNQPSTSSNTEDSMNTKRFPN